MSTLTPNYDFILPGVNDPTDQDLWGGYLNENFSSLDTLIKANSLAEIDPVLTTGYTITTDDNNKTFIFDTSSGNLTATLPAASGFDNGFTFTLKKVGATGTLNISGTVDGDLNPTLTDENKSKTITGNGTAWYFKSDYTEGSAVSPGTVIQRKYVQSSTAFSGSSLSYVTTAISGALDSNLSSASNKIRITVILYAGVGANLGNALYFTVKTGSTDLAGSFSGLGGLMQDSPNGPTEARALSCVTMYAERTPGSVTPETYTIWARAGYTATNYYVGTSADGNITLPTTIIIEEIQV
jgi:hypothetical protein